MFDLNNKFLSIGNIITFILILGFLALCFQAIDILLILFASFVITCAINPMIDKMETKIPRIWATTIVLLALILAGLLIIVPLITVCVKEASGLAINFPNLLDSIDKFLNIKIFDKHISDFVTLDALKDSVLQASQKVIENSISAGKVVASFISAGFAISITVFYLTYDKQRIQDKFIEFFPQTQKEKALNIVENISSKVGNYIFAQGIAMVFVGALTTIGLLLIGHDHAFLLGFITCVMDIVPVIGPAIAIAIGLITSVSDGAIFVLLTFVIYIIAQWAQNQLLRPIVFGKLLNMHPLVIIVALLAAAKFLGFWGAILSPAIACVVCTLIDELYLDKINKKD